MSARIGSLGNVTYKKQVDYDTQITTDQLVYLESENFDAKPMIYKDNALIGQSVQTDDVLIGYEAATGTIPLKALRYVNNDLVAGSFEEAGSGTSISDR